MFMLERLGWMFCLGGGLALALSAADEPVGRRPYELDWANRLEDGHPPLVNFEDLTGWRVECRDATATFVRTREQQIWGQYVGKLTYRAAGSRPQITLLPPQPIPIASAFDAVTLWGYGNNWGYSPDPNTPPVSLNAVFEDRAGKEFTVHLDNVNWKEWHLVHRRLPPEQIEKARGGARFKGLMIGNAKNKEDRTIYFDNLAAFTEQFPPLKFEPRPERGVVMFPGQSSGANTGPGRLPFPTRETTILPDNLTTNFSTRLAQEGSEFVFTYAEPGANGQSRGQVLQYHYAPRTGAWDDLTARWQRAPSASHPPITPCAGGGVYVQTAKGPMLPAKAELLGAQKKGETVEARWRLSAEGVTAEVAYTFRLWSKSLVVDVVCLGGQVGEVRFGKAVGLRSPRLVTLPYYPAQSGRPAIAVSTGPEGEPLFLAGHVDWYRSNGSILWAQNRIEEKSVTYNGGTRYLPKTDGRRNDCFERFFLTVSPRFEEVLPNIPNPVSPYKQITGTRVWRAHGASKRDKDAEYWRNVHRHGMTQVVVTDHETGWRDGGESFTFRTRPAPGKGGDQGQYDYARLMQDQLGFVYGPYNNFTDFAPVNEYWSFDLISRTSDNQLQRAWMRCYAPKPARAVEFCARLAPIIEKKFRFSTAYCDVHTAVAPWHRVDYDARVPGAGTFAAVFYAYGEIMLLQKLAWGGPVYSEGNYHSFYTGLTDGNYGQDQSYRPAENPWLVDFDLGKMHDLGCNFGMGNPEMFYANVPQPKGTPAERDAWLDRFLAATVAFGHPGFLVMEGGMGNALRSYYMLQQLHSRYCLASVAEIRYADADGKLLDSSAAVASGAYRLSQVATRYTDGTITVVNGHRTNRLVTEVYGRKVNLPPNGYCGWTEDGAIEVFSGEARNHRCDYAATPAYLYADGRGQFSRFPLAASQGIGICRILTNNTFEVIPYQNTECGFAITVTAAIALDKSGKELGPATWRTARGLTYVQPVKEAFSYHLEGQRQSPPTLLACERDQVVPGEEVRVRGKQTHSLRIPAEAKPGERIWREFEGAWIDFTVAKAMETKLTLEKNVLSMEIISHWPYEKEFIAQLGAQIKRLVVSPEKPSRVGFSLPPPSTEKAEVLAVELSSGEYRERLETALLTEKQNVKLIELPVWEAGMQMRSGPEQSHLGDSGAQVAKRTVSCGEINRDGIFMHPPYQKGVGLAFALYQPISLPEQPSAAFRAWVGKADGSDPGDGILFQVLVMDETGRATLAASRNVTNHAWFPIEADLTAWAGKKIRLKLVADVGPKNNSSGDWAGWAGMRIESREAELISRLESNVEPHRREAGPYPLTGLPLAALRQAKAGWLHFEGKGLEGGGAYKSFGSLNGHALGEMPPAHGNEMAGQFSASVRLPLTAASIRSLDRRNRFALSNPNKDCFSVRRFWIELEMPDGRKVSSDLSTATWSQPPEWPHAEGVKVPHGQDLEVTVWLNAD